jgi:hypothetical protein
MHPVPYDAADHRRSAVTIPGFHEGRAPRNKGRRYPADPPTVEEIIAVMPRAGARVSESSGQFDSRRDQLMTISVLDLCRQR